MQLSTVWVDGRTAAIYLKPCTPKHLVEEVGPFLERKANTRPGASTARGGGYVYHRHNLERVRAIMDALGCTALRAAQTWHAVKELERRELVPWLLESVLDEELQRTRAEVRT